MLDQQGARISGRVDAMSARADDAREPSEGRGIDEFFGVWKFRFLNEF